MKFTDAYGRDNTWKEEIIYNSVGPGWKKLLQELLIDLEKLGWDGNLFQVKEKFGGLRFYIGYDTNEIFNRISEAERESMETCEQCGEKGELRNAGWIVCLCSQCFEQQTKNEI